MAIHLPQKIRVLSNECHGSAGRVLCLDSRMRFKPGQLVSLSLTLAGPSRLYSICSAPGAASLDVIYNLVEAGELTPELWQVSAGDIVFLQGPRGGFVEPVQTHPTQRIWWIGNGTGISPYISFLRHFKATGSNQAHLRSLVFGCRTPDDAWFLEELREAARGLNLTCILCLSAANAPELAALHPVARLISPLPHQPLNLSQGGIWLHFGRLTAWSGLHLIPQTDVAMLCGSSLMISEVRDLLLATDMPASNVFAETYF